MSLGHITVGPYGKSMFIHLQEIVELLHKLVVLHVIPTRNVENSGCSKLFLKLNIIFFFKAILVIVWLSTCSYNF